VFSIAPLAASPGGGATTSAVRFVVVDDHELVRDGLRQLLEAGPRFECVGEAGTVAEGVSLVASEHPDLVVLDVRLPDGSGVDACRRMLTDSPVTAVLILTAFPSALTADQAREAGARGYVSKQAGRERILKTIRGLLAGEEIFELPPSGTREGDWDRLRHLTPRERQVLGLLARGWTNREIAGDLGLAEKTVKNYVSMILVKLGVENRAAAAALFVREVERAGGSTWI
jgi:two-component system, NarL family, response regulator DevR